LDADLGEEVGRPKNNLAAFGWGKIVAELIAKGKRARLSCWRSQSTR